MIIGDGNQMEVCVFGCIDVVIYCDEDIEVTLRDVVFVPGAYVGIYSFTMFQKDHVITVDHTWAHVLDGSKLFGNDKFRNFIKATQVATHENTPPVPAAVVRPCRQSWVDVNDLHCSLGQAPNAVLRESARLVSITVIG